MKRLLHIGSISLVAYILSLPILLSVHSIQHHAHEEFAHEHPSGEAAFHESPCNLCQLYHDQLGIVNQSVPQDSVPDWVAYQKPAYLSQERRSQSYISLRAPPSC